MKTFTIVERDEDTNFNVETIFTGELQDAIKASEEARRDLNTSILIYDEEGFLAANVSCKKTEWNLGYSYW